MSSFRVVWLPRREGQPRIPAVFVLGVIMLVASLSMLLIRPLAAATAPAPASTPYSAIAGATGGANTPSSAATTPAASKTPVASPTPTQRPYAGLTGYVWPLKDAIITLPFGPTDWGEWIVDGKKFHDGVDMATQCGDYVLAAHDGVVLAAGREYDDYMGWIGDLTPYYNLLDTKHWWPSLPIVIVIDDGDGYRSIYAHEYKVAVSPGQRVKAGQIIGYEGQTGNASGCHVHFGLFSPSESARFALDPTIVAKDLMPSYEIARIDPLMVLPFRCEVEETRTLRPAEAASCGPLPTPTPKATTQK